MWRCLCYFSEGLFDLELSTETRPLKCTAHGAAGMLHDHFKDSY